MSSETSGHKWFILIAMCLSIFTIAFNSTAIMNATVAIRNELDLTTTTLSWVINAYLLTTASCIIIGGQFSDLYGRRKMFYLGAVIFLIASLLIATGQNFEALLLGRILQGLGAAFITPGSLAVVKTTFSKEENAYAIGMWSAAIGLGFALGPTMSGVITDFIDWRYIFWINIPILATAIIIIMIKDKSKHIANKKNAHLDILGLFLLVAGILPFTLGLIEGNNWGWNSYATIALLIAGPIILILFWQVETHIKHPLVHFEDFEKKIYVAGNIAMGTTVFVIMTVLYFINLYMQTPVLLNFTALKAGIYMLPFSGGMFITSSFVSSKLTDRFGFRLPISASFFAMSFAFACMSLININTEYWELGIGLLVIGAGTGIAFSSAPSLGMSALPDEKAGEASGVITTVNYICGVAAISIGTILFHHYGIKAATRIISTFYFSNIQTHQVHEILLGDNSALGVLLASAPAVKSKLIIEALQSGGLASLCSVMVMGSLATLICAVTCFQLIPKTHGKK